MLKGVIALLIAAGMFVMWQYRQHMARVRLQELDGGKRCVSCNGTQTSVEGDKARCLQCGYVANLAFYRAAKVSSGDIESVTRPESRDL